MKVNSGIRCQTRLSLNVYKSNYLDACAAGSYSPDGLPPCSPCPTGSYQDTFGQTSCRECPGSQTTDLEEATTVLQCQGKTC